MVEQDKPFSGCLLLNHTQFLKFSTGLFRSFSVGHDHETRWSNPMKLADLVECKRGGRGKSVQLPIRIPNALLHLGYDRE